MEDNEVIDMVNNRKYDDDSAFFDIVNGHAIDVENKRREEIKNQHVFEITERAVAASIKRDDVAVQNQRKFKERAEFLRKKRILKMVTLIMAGSILIGGSVYAAGRVSVHQDIKKATSIAMDYAREDLVTVLMHSHGGSFTFSSDDDIGYLATSLTTKDYSMLGECSLEEVFAFKMVLPRAEFEEFIRALEYTTPDGTYHYISFEQYLNINGFGSEREFENRAEALLLQAYKEGRLVAPGSGGSKKGGK